MGAENAELVQIAPVTREEIGTAGMSTVGLELRPLPQGDKNPSQAQGLLGQHLSALPKTESRETPVRHSACV